MKKGILYISFLCAGHSVFAQTAPMQIHTGGSLYVHPSDKMSVWGNVTNNGTWGSLEGGESILFSDTIINSTAATLPGAGLFSFTQPRPAPYAANNVQILNGGHNATGASGASYPDIKIDNSNNIELNTTDSKVRDTVTFTNGKFILNQNDFTVGNTAKGTILGYTENRFFVTNDNSSTNVKGQLIRENFTGAADFPVGSSTSSYTPARLTNSGTADDYKVRVIQGYGSTTTTVPQEGVGIVWVVRESTAGGGNVTLDLQHNSSTNGSLYNVNNAFVTRYVDVAPNNLGGAYSQTKWDLVPSPSTDAGPGTITTGTSIATGLVLSRSGLTDFGTYTLYTKSIYDITPLPVELLRFDVALQKDKTSLLTWVTASEKDNDRFEIEHSTDAKIFEYIGTQQSLAPNGNSTSELNYSFIHKNPVRGINYYRLKQFDKDGTFTYSDIKAVNLDGDAQDVFVSMLSSNPVREAIRFGITALKNTDVQAVLYTDDGKLVTNEIIKIDVGTQEWKLDMTRYAAAMYYLKLVDVRSNQQLESVKVIKVD